MIMLSVNKDSFTSSSPIYMLFTYKYNILIDFFCLITLSIINSTVLNRSSQNEHPCFFPDLSEKVFSFSLLSVMLAADFSRMTFMKEIPS